jgi:hypothetical protein
MGHLERGLSPAEIAKELGRSKRTMEVQVAYIMQLLEVPRRSDLITAWRAHHEPGHPERVHLPDIGAGSPGARRCSNPECVNAGRWLVGTMVPNQDRKLICTGCYRVYEPHEVTGPADAHDQR